MPLSKIQDIGNQVVPNFGTNRNILINGAMNVAQRATSATGIGANADTNKYPTMDRWNTFHGGSTAGRLTMTQDSSAPAGFANSMKLDCTTADTSIAAGEEFLISQKIEGQNLQTISKGTADAKQMVLSWYAKGTPKTYGIELYDNDNSGRHFSNTWTVTSDWQRFTQVIPADTTGTFDDDNALSLYVLFWIHAGSTYSSGSSASSWSTLSNGNRAAGVGSIFSSTSNELFLTGVQLEVGSAATEFEHEPFERTLKKCERYYQNSYETSAGNFPGVSTSSDNAVIHTSWNDGNVPFGIFRESMRTNPTVVLRERNANTTGKITTNSAQKTASANDISEKGVGYIGVTSGVNLVYNAYTYELKAEL